MILYKRDKTVGSDAWVYPAERMDKPYDPCWCGSGRKWKWCHKDRDKMEPVPVGKLIADLREQFRHGYCSHPQAPEGCSERLINAHTVQRNGGLQAIAEDGHVLSPLGPIQVPDNAAWKLEKVGVRSASTFLGFCNLHDSTLFRPAECGDVALDEWTAFLLCFRALAFESYNKVVGLRQVPILLNMDRGENFARQVQIQSSLFGWRIGLELALRDLRSAKSEYDRAWLARDTSGFYYCAVTFADVLPIAGCGVFTPEFDLNARRLQSLRRQDELEHVCFNLTALGEKSVLILGSAAERQGVARKLMESLLAVPQRELADAAARLALDQVENIYLKPSWWDGLPEVVQRSMSSRMRSWGPQPPEHLLSDGTRYFEEVEVDNIFGRLS